MKVPNVNQMSLALREHFQDGQRIQARSQQQAYGLMRQ